jgi:hypothetical protein
VPAAQQQQNKQEQVDETEVIPVFKRDTVERGSPEEEQEEVPVVAPSVAEPQDEEPETPFPVQSMQQPTPASVSPADDDEEVIAVPPSHSSGQTPPPTQQEASPALIVTDGRSQANGTIAYHTDTVLDGDRYTILLDSGAVSNLCGSLWAKEVARRAKRRGNKAYCKPREVALSVSGVGDGVQRCAYDSVLPISLRTGQGSTVSSSYTAATVPNSQLPALLGLDSLRANRCVLDFVNLKLYMCGPADVEFDKAMPEGTEVFQCHLTPSGHLGLPCCEAPTAVATTIPASHLKVSQTPAAAEVEQEKRTKDDPSE